MASWEANGSVESCVPAALASAARAAAVAALVTRVGDVVVVPGSVGMIVATLELAISNLVGWMVM